MKNNVLFPLVDKEIDIADCIENVDCIDGLIKISSLPLEYKQKENWKEICLKCKYHDD